MIATGEDTVYQMNSPLLTLLYLCLAAFVAGAMSGVVSTFIATPADMVKTRILTRTSGGQPNFATQPDTVINGATQQPVIDAQPDGTLVVASMGGAANGTIGMGTMIQQPLLETQGDLLSEEILSAPPYGGSSGSNNNPFLVAKRIGDEEGTSVLFTGVYERCIGAIPRFGITLGAHEWLEHYASSVGLLSSHLSS